MNRRALFIALVVGILGVFLLLLYQRRFEAEASGGEKVKLLIALKQIDRGKPITEDAIATLARYAVMVNEQTENIGARRLHTILEKVLDEISFEAPDMKKKNVKVDGPYVTKQLADIVKNQDLSRYIL